MPFQITPVGHVRGGREQPWDQDWGHVRSAIEIDPDRFTAEALNGLEAFSHVEILFLFDRAPQDAIVSSTRHPCGRSDLPRMGIFAQRGKERPNRLGITICRIVAVDGRRLEVEGLDALDGTPVIDIKPVLSAFLPRGAFAEPQWAKDVMRDYW